MAIGDARVRLSSILYLNIYFIYLEEVGLHLEILWIANTH